MLDNQLIDDGAEILEGRYRVIKRLGSGAFGEIYKGKPTQSLFTNKFESLIPSFLLTVEKKATGEIYAAKMVS